MSTDHPTIKQEFSDNNHISTKATDSNETPPNSNTSPLDTSSHIMKELKKVPEPCLVNSIKMKPYYDSSGSDWETPVEKFEEKKPEMSTVTEPKRKKLTAEVKIDIARWKAKLKLLKEQSFNWSQERRYKINKKFVSVPSKKIEGDTPIRPFPKELLWDDPRASGTATEVFAMVFQRGTSKTPWLEANFSAPVAYCKKHDREHQEVLQSYTGVSEEERSRRRRLKVLENVQELLWMMYYGRIDRNVERTFRLMIEQFHCRFDENRKLKLITKNDYSLIWNKNILLQNSFIMGQREAGWRLRPVFIDGLAFLNMLVPFKKTTLPMIFTNVLLELLTHFILDGHKTVVYLPAYYQTSYDHIDNVEVFKYLLDMNLFVFVDVRNRKALQQKTVVDAEENFGIIVSSSETLSTVKSIQCFPIVHRYSSKPDEFVLTTLFEESDRIATRFEEEIKRRTKQSSLNVCIPDCQLDPKDDDRAEYERRSLKENTTSLKTSGSERHSSVPEIETNEDSKVTAYNWNDDEIFGYKTESSENSSDTASNEKTRQPRSYQNFAEKCRLYTHSEKGQIDTSLNQLTLESQVQLLSSFVHFTVFRFQRHRQIQVFFLLISRYLPELLPDWMKKSQVDDVATSIEKCKE